MKKGKYTNLHMYKQTNIYNWLQLNVSDDLISLFLVIMSCLHEKKNLIFYRFNEFFYFF